MSIEIRFKQACWKTTGLVYEDGSHVLSLGMDLQATASGGWGVLEHYFNKWTVPKDEPISEEKRSEIKRNIDEWARNNNTSITFSRGITKAELQARVLSKGWTVEDTPDGGWKAIPPKK
jgi:hypothetical protein